MKLVRVGYWTVSIPASEWVSRKRGGPFSSAYFGENDHHRVVQLYGEQLAWI